MYVCMLKNFMHKLRNPNLKMKKKTLMHQKIAHLSSNPSEK